MKKQFVTVFSILLGILIMSHLPLQAQQDGEPVVIGTYRTIHSKILDENRTLLIHLPRGYEQANNSYPVIYMLYGNHVSTYFSEAVSVVDNLGSSGRIPESILVGIMNTDRYRDLLPDTDGEPTGIGDFIRFFREELFPYVEKSYRTKPYRIIVGPQAGANFSLFTMMKEPDMFQAFIIESPFRWRGGRNLMMDMAASFFPGHGEFRRFMHISYRVDDELEREALPYLKKLSSLVEESGIENFRLKLDLVSVTDEFLFPFRIKEGLKELFIHYPLPQDLEVDSLDDVLAFYKDLSNEYGFEVDAPEHVLSHISDLLMQKEKTEEMLRILEYILERDPSSGNALWRMGNHFERNGELEKAVTYYERMILFLGSDAGMIKNRVDMLKKKIEAPRKK